jgi:hypothetical protein
MAAYERNMTAAVGTVIEADLVSTAIIEFMEKRAQWSGRAQNLLGALNPIVGETIVRHRDWPKTPRALAGKVQRAAASLRKIGIVVKRGDKHSRERHDFILEKGGIQHAPSARSVPSAVLSQDPVHIVELSAHRPDRPDQTCTSKPLKTNGSAHSEHRTRHCPHFSGGDNDPFDSFKDPSLRLKGDAA